MKMMKKVAVLLLAVCLAVPCFSMMTHAASGKVMFTDPTTAVGETLELKGVLTSSTDIEDRKVVMTYDTTMLRFKEGNNVQELTAGELTYEVKGKRDGNRVEFLMYFDVLKEGNTKVEAKSYEAWDSSNEAIQCSLGSSSIKIEEGELPPVDTTPVVTGVEVVVDGIAYTLVNEFEESLIPAGYEASAIEYNGSTCKVLVNPNTGTTLAYLVDAEGEGDFFSYNIDTAQFEPYQMLTISDTTSIVLLSDTEDITLPDTYTKTVIIVNGNEFPAWQSLEDGTRCILYALNSNGVKALYQYDSTEGTYQRVDDSIMVDAEEEKESAFGKFTDLLMNHMDYVVLGTGLGFILFVLTIVILGVKLHNRNAELDEIYDELGIDLEDKGDSEKVVKSKENDEESDEEEISFVNISEELEDDVVIAEVEDDEIEVEFFEQQGVCEEVETVEEADTMDVLEELKELEEKVFAQEIVKFDDEDDTEYFDEDDDREFEISFIDLDD